MFNGDSDEGKPDYLRGRYKDSFAYPSLCNRLPDILTRVIDILHRSWSSFTNEERVESNLIISRISNLKYALEHNRSFDCVCDKKLDCEMWNKVLMDETFMAKGRAPAFFDSPWLYTECYVYRKLAECFHLSPRFSQYDWFSCQKKAALVNSIPSCSGLLNQLKTMVSEDEHFKDKLLEFLLKVSLWANKCDLSISGGTENDHHSNAFLDISAFESYLLIDHVNSALKMISDLSASQPDGLYIDYVIDNSGFELATDLVLSNYLLSSGIASKITLHCKSLPWFVSDATPFDIHWTIDFFSKQDELLSALASSLKTLMFTERRLEIVADNFWTLPCTLDQIAEFDYPLFQKLTTADLCILKGDLNYRKLSQDRLWAPGQNYKPPNIPCDILAIRTIKSESVFNLCPEKFLEASNRDKDWNISGNYGLIQLVPKTLRFE